MGLSFLDLFNASISASWLVLVVIGLRFLLKKAPKSIHCLLWALVAFRLVCPVSIESPVSLMPSSETLSMDYRVEQSIYTSQQTVLDIVENPIYPENVNMTIDSPISSRTIWDIEWSVIWFIGVGFMALYVLISWLRLQRQVAASISIASDIRLCDHIESPFILGVFRPVIYLPSDIGQDALDHVLAHEKAHLARKDHWWKPLGFGLLTIHWFNPVMWLAYILLCRDIELACDEKVIRAMNPQQKKAYSTALLGCSVRRPLIAACPLAFGEVGVKERVKTVLNYKKPAFWIVVVAVILCIAVAVCFLTDPLSLTVNDIVESGEYTILAQCEEYLTLTMSISDVHPDSFSQNGHTYREKEVIVYESDTTAIWLRNVRLASEGDHLLDFEFDISYDLPNVGTVVLPYRIDDDNSYQIHWRIAPAPGLEDITSDSLYRSYLRGTGPDNRFSISMDTAYIRNLPGNFVNIGVCMNQLTYAKSGMEPELNRGVYSSAVSQDKSFHASGDEIYRIGWDSRQREVFLDPYGAFEQFCTDYAAGICYIRGYNALNPLTPLNYYEYLRLGWQTVPDDEVLAAQCAAVSDFLDIYDNSMIPANQNENAHNGTYKAGDLLAQHAIFSTGFGTGDMIFHLNEHTLSVYDLSGNELLSSTRVVIDHPTREELLAEMNNTMAVWKTSANGAIISDMKPDFIPDAAEIETWEFHADNAQNHYPEYTLFFFDGELRWFAENYNNSYGKIWAVTVPMPEDTLLPSGSYVGQEKLYWAGHSSFFAYKMEMDVTDEQLVIRFNDGEWSEVLPMNRSWQDECPIGDKRRAQLAELTNINPILSIRDLSGCRYLVIDDTHFLIERKGELFLVAWNHSDIGLEILQYVYRIVPYAEDLVNDEYDVAIGMAKLETSAADQAIYRYLLEMNSHETSEDTYTSVSFRNNGTAYHNPDYPRSITRQLELRIAHYIRGEDGTITEESAEMFPVILSMNEHGDGSYEILDCVRDDANYTGSELLLETECWRQAYAHFEPDLEKEISALWEKYPEYFRKDTTYGLDLV